MTKKYKHRAEADVGLIFIAYNLRRLMNILGTEVLKEHLRFAISLFTNILHQTRLKLSQFKQFYNFNNFNNFINQIKNNCLKLLIFNQNF